MKQYTNIQLQYLQSMGIQPWVLRDSVRELNNADVALPDVEAPSAAPEVAALVVPKMELPTINTPAIEPSLRTDVSDADWDELQDQVRACTLCDLHASRTQTVFGVGDQHADLLVIGEAPGQDEDLKGEPFVGRAGQLLNAMLFAMGLPREQVYIANILKCKPPKNRDPEIDEVMCCDAYLMRQIQLVQPRLILATGRIAAQNLLGSNLPIGKLRGEVYSFRDTDIPLVATYHPAYLLRSPKEKRKAWQDLQLVLANMQSTSP